MKRTANAIWKGTGKEGTGTLSSQSGILKDTPYNFVSRFGDGPHTNPEELIAAAHAGCFAMKLSFVLVEAGFTAEELNASCTVTLEDGAVRTSHLVLKAKVPGIGKEAFEACVANAKENCPITKSLTASVSIESTLL